MSSKEYTNPNNAHPHRCAFLMDDVIDATHPWNKQQLKEAYRTLRYCMKHSEVNADFSQKPKYLAPRENYEELFNSKKVKEVGDEKREEERLFKESLKSGNKEE